MKRFENILYVHDPESTSGHALQRAARLANANSAKLTIASVMRELPRTLVNLDKTLTKLHEDELKSQLKRVAGKDLEIQTCVLTGTPFMEIIRAVKRNGHDLVIKAAEGRGGVSGILFGSTDLNLFRKCPCPVWIIKPSRRRRFARILAAVDPDPSEKTNAELNSLVLTLAGSLAAREGSELHIAHAWSMNYENLLRTGRASLSKAEVDRMVRATRKIHRQWLDEMISGHDFHGTPYKLHHLKGIPGEVIPRLVRKKGIELVVMGTVARTGLPGFLIGNTAEKVLAAVDCSILAVKPASFKTPVKT